jgi:calcium binding protein 39
VARGAGMQLRFVNDLENLKLIMNCLKDPSKSIQFESFHVFKVFVVNREKSQGVMDVLRHNRDKLLKYMSNFQSERGALAPTSPAVGGAWCMPIEW